MRTQSLYIGSSEACPTTVTSSLSCTPSTFSSSPTSSGEDTRDAHRPVDYQYNYSPEALAITLPTAHFDLKEEVFTMGLSVDGIPCGEWTGTIT